MAWTAADIYKISKGTNQKQNQWTANDVQKAAQGTNVSRAKKEQDNLYAIALDSYVNKNQNVEAKYGAPLKTFSLPQTSSFPSTAAKSNNVLEQVGSGAAAYGSGAAQKLKASYAPYSQKDEFDLLNEWFDTDDNRNLADAVRRVDSTHGAYTDADLIKNGGWTQAQIDEAREKNAEYDAIPAWKRATVRASNTIGGIADSVAGGAVMPGELGAQSAKNIAETQKNWAKVQQEIKGDERAEKLFQLLTDVDMDYNPAYPVSKNWELALMGYGSEEIRNMRDRLAGLEVNDSIDPEQSVGYQLYRRGQDLTGAAQSGLSDGTRAVQSAVTSAAENLAVSAINPAAVLPVLSLQGASDAMGQSIEKGESAGKALAGGALKFGAGWAINSVGMADLAKTMGSDYAKDTMAGQIADFVRGMAGKSDFAQKYPAVANAISGGVDNALQAFAETYADTAIDAALGDPDVAEELFSKEHLLSALESGLSGGASGALGGAVGTGLAKLNDGDASLKGWADYYDDLDQIERAAAAAKKTQQRTQEPGMQSQTVQEGAAEKAAVAEPKAESAAEEKTEPAEPVKSQNANPAVRQFEQAVEAGGLTGKTIRLFTPEAGNEANRAALEEAYGVKLPETAASTRRMLRDLAAQQNEVKSAATAQPEIKPQTVEKAGEMVETSQSAGADSSPNEGSHWQDGTAVLDEQSPTVQKIDGPAAEGRDYADAELKADPAASEGSSPLRETYGLREPSSQTARQAEVASTLKQWGIKSDSAVQDISQKLPKGVEAQRYAAAASTIYRVAQMDEVKSFDDALKLAGAMNHTALNVDYVLDSGDAGRLALKQAYLYGADIKEQPNYGGQLTSMSTSGEGTVYYKGTLDHDGADMGSRLIELNARATGTDAILQNVLQNDPNVKAYVDTETGRIFFGDSVTDVFGTILHEDYHWYNSLDSEGAKTLQDHALQYLAKMDGYESVDEMIREKLDVYARQGLTYAQAAEELVADAWRGIFSTEADFKRWVEFQRGQAEKNAGTAGKVKAVMNRVKELLTDIISRAKEVLTHDPDNAAALKAKRLAEAERRILQDEYFAHAEKAMDNLRAAKENAAALKTEDTAGRKGIRYSLPEMAKETETEKTKRQMVLTIHPAQTNAERTARVSETNWSGQKTQDIYKAIRTILNEFGIPSKTFRMEDLDVEFNYGSRNIQESVNKQRELTSREYSDFALVQANIEEVLANAVPLEAHADKKGKPHVDGMIVLASALQDGERIIPVRAELKLYDNRPTALYMAIAETTAEESRNAANKKEPDRKVRQESSLTQEAAFPGSSDRTGSEDGGSASAEVHPTGSSDLTITDFYNRVKHDANFAKYFSNEVAYKAEGLDALQEESKALEQRRRDLKEERSNWMDSDEVKAIEAKKKSYGIFSAEGKAYRESEEYQNYLAKRKEFNQRGAELDDRIGEVNDRIREANAQLETRRMAVQKDKQLAYNAAAEKTGGAAEYHRQLAKEKFGTTDTFEKAGYILPDGEMLNFAQNEATRDTDHREIMDVFGPTDVSEGTDALNKFISEGNIRVMAEQPGLDLSASVEPTAQQLEQIREMAKTLGAEKRQFTLDFSTKDGGIAATKDYSGRIDVDKIVREIKEYYKTGELPAESSLARFRYQLNEQAAQADRDAKRNRQRQASRVIADNSAAIRTLTEMMGLTRGVRVSDDSILGKAEQLIKANGAKGKADAEHVAREMRTLLEYMRTNGADMNKAQGLGETIAGEILDHATYRNTELWEQFPEYHELGYTVDKNGKAKAELVRQYGSWGEAVAEARRHGVKLRQEEGHRDGNPAEQYESIVNDTRATGGVKDGAAALFRSAAKAAGVEGAASMESTEWLDVLMNVHDAIKPKMMSRFSDVSEYEDAKVELAGRIIGELMNVPEMSDAQAIFDSFQQWQRKAAAAAAGDEERAAKAVKDLKSVQKEQRKEFDRRLRENQKAGNQSDAVQQMTEAERLLDENLDALGVDITNAGDMAEKLDVLKEAYEREWKAERKRLADARQEMLDEIALEHRELRTQIDSLSAEVAGERRRADFAEQQLIYQQDEMMEWAVENNRKKEEWEEKQRIRNEKAKELMEKHEAENKAHAQMIAEKRVQRVRDGRKAEELKRSIRNNLAQLNQMVLRPTKGKYVQPRLIQQAIEVAKLADMTILNETAVRQLTVLETSISQTMGDANDPSSLAYDWDKTGVPKMIQTLRADLTNTKQAKLDKLHQQLTEAEALGDSDKTEKMRDRLKRRIKETEARTYLPLTVDQLRMLKAITAGTLHVIRTENKTLSLAKTEEIDAFAQNAGLEVLAAKGNETGDLRDLATKYNLDMLGAKRVFRMLGGYAKNSQMERIADMLNDGQRRQTEITVEGTKLFDDVTGKANLKQMGKFAGPGAELVDIGLKDQKGSAVPLTHAQLCSLYMHLQNADSREHLLNGGLVLPDAKQYNKGKIERAYQQGQTVQIGMLTDSEGNAMADTILNTVENALTDYDRAWIADMKEFFGNYTTKLINETSMKLVGFQRANVKNYYPIAVDRAQLATEIEGLKLDATIEGRGFLKERVKSGKPILLEECSSVVQRSLRDTAAYAGLAAPIRDANRILNADVETRDSIGKLKNGIIKAHWGQDAVNYLDYLLTDLQSKQRKRSDGIGRVMGRLRGNYAGAILTLNPGVAIAQAASLPTAGAVLGSDTMAAVLPFVKNFSSKQRTALEAEISQHGDALLQYRLRGSQRGELASIGVDNGAVQNLMDALPKSVTGWINGMDEITVAALWEGAKHYVEHHPAEFNLSVASGDSSPNEGSPWQDGEAVLDEQSPAAQKSDGSAVKIKQDEAYWAAVNQMYQRVIEETQPNYTVMQRAGIQRSDNEITKTLTMFTTQRFQNYGILADAVMDYNAQKARYKTQQNEQNKAELDRAGRNLRRAASSQVIQTAVFALMKIGADFLLHRWDREQDENGDVTAESLWNRFAGLFTESAAGNFLFGSGVYSIISNAMNGTDYDVVSATNISAVNDLFAATSKLYTLIRKDTTGMDEEELDAYHQKLRKAWVNVMEYGLDILGVPAANARKMVEAFGAYAEDVKGLARGEGISLSSVPSSATGQYDRLFNAIQSGDSDEAKAALKKLDQMGKTDQVESQLKSRLKKYDEDILDAAKARNEGKDKDRQDATKRCILKLYDAMGIERTGKGDAAKREEVIDLVTSAVNAKADELLKAKDDGSSYSSVYGGLTDALESGRAKDVNDEISRLLTSGKSADAIKSAITGQVKDEYLAGSSADRKKLETMLLKLRAEGKALYEEKNFETWLKDAEKQKATAKKDEWKDVR